MINFITSPYNGKSQKKEFIIFLRFLKEEKAYSSYLNELKLNNYYYSVFVKKYGRNYSLFFNSCDPYLWIQYGFIWSKTKKGDAFWFTLDTKWKNKYRNEILRK